MIIANLRNKRDYLKAVQYQNELINISIQNDLNIAKARQSQKGGRTDEAPKPIEDQYTKDEILLNQNKQLEVAKKLLGDLGFNFEETTNIINSLTQDEKLILISSFPNIKKQISERYNLKFLTPTFFVEWFQKYCANFESAKGLEFGEPERPQQARSIFKPLIQRMVSEQGRESYAKKQARPETIEEEFRGPRYQRKSTQPQRQIFRGEEEDNFDYGDDEIDVEAYFETPYVQPTKEGSKFDALTDNLQAILQTLPNVENMGQIINQIGTSNLDNFTETVGEPQVVKEDLIDSYYLMRQFIALLTEPDVQQRLSTNTPENQQVLNYIQNVISDLPVNADLGSLFSKYDNDPNTSLKYYQAYGIGIRNQQIEELMGIIDPNYKPSQKALPTETTASLKSRLLTEAKEPVIASTEKLSLIKMAIQEGEFPTTTEFNKLSMPEMFKIFKVNKDYQKGANIHLAEENPAKPRTLSQNAILKGKLMSKYKDSRGIMINNFALKQQEGLLTQENIELLQKGKKEVKEGVGFRRNNNKVGRGLNLVQEEPKYKAFGKYIIHWGQLNNNDILNVKYACMGNIPSLKPSAISDVFKEFIIDILETGKMNDRMYKQIPNEEKKIFEKMVMGAGLMNQLKLKKVYIDQELEDIKKFNILKGEYLAGNDNDKLKKELRRYVVQFMNDNRISKNEGTRLLMELSF